MASGIRIRSPKAEGRRAKKGPAAPSRSERRRTDGARKSPPPPRAPRAVHTHTQLATTNSNSNSNSKKEHKKEQVAKRKAATA